MTPQIPHIDIPNTDLWALLFDRPKPPFPASKVIYQDPNLPTRNYTYAHLCTTTQKLGSGLISKWSPPKGSVFALFLQNNVHTPAITWGIHWAGGIVSPANPAYNVRELTHHLNDSGAIAIFTQRSLLKVVVEACAAVHILKSRIILVDDDAQGQHEYSHWTSLLDHNYDEKKSRQRVEINAEKDLAFLVYSSGTTGLPKGVQLTHRNVVSNLLMVFERECVDVVEGRRRAALVSSEDRVLSVLPFYHIYGLQCLVHLPAYAGLTTFVMPSFDLKSFCEIIQKYKITYTYTAPPIILHLAKSPLINNYDLSSLRAITSGAAPLTKELIYAVHDRLGIEVKQAYGLSETSPVTHIQRKWDEGLGSNGPALANQIIKFMDPDGKEVPTGKEGELWISGPNVFLGYHNNPEATSSSKTPSNFFKTGDIGYHDSAGNMYITDRVKELIKYKGFQVAPAELEGILMGHELINDVAVIGVEDEARASEVPLACVVLKDGTVGDEGMERRIVEWIAEKVAGHKRLRGGVLWVDEVPKSASGKILRRVLKEKMRDRFKVKAKL